METLIKDIRYGLRGLLKQPVFTSVAVLTLALGIGANTAIFSVVNAVVLRPLPYHQPDRLVMLWGMNAKEGNPGQPASFLDFGDIKSQAKSFSEISAASPLWNFIVAGDSGPEQMRGLYVSANLFQLLGVGPQRGRTFLLADDQTGATPVVILSNRLWQRRFGGDENLLGKTLTLSGTTMTIVGIMPEGFQFLEPEAEVWVPLNQNQFANSARNVRLLNVVARLKPDVQPEQAAAELTAISRNLESQYPDTNTGVGLRLLALHEHTTARVKPALQLLSGAVALVLLIACANVVNLMLVRGAARKREIAVRVALGAGRIRLVRQLLTEGIILALLGGVGGVLLATWGMKLLLSLNPFQLPRYHEISIDLPVLGFTLFASIITGVCFGLAPAWQAMRFDLNTSLKEGGRNASTDAGHHRLSNLLVIAELAMAMVLLVGAGLLIRSFVHLLEVKPGFVTENVLTMQIGLPNSTYAQAPRRIAFYQQLEANLKELPEVSSVGLVTRLPLLTALNNVTTFLNIEGSSTAMGQRPEVDFRRASPGYFQTLGIPLISGRLFTDQDVASNTGAVMINRALARRLFADQDPLGKRVSIGLSSGQQTQWQTIVGIVGDVRHLSLDVEPRPELYFHTNTSPPFGPVVVVRTTADPTRIISSVRAKVRELDPDLPVAHINTMEQLVGQSVAQRRFGMLLLGIFAVLAMLLAGVGIYGVMSYSVTQRRQEMGVRMALGAQAGDVLRLVVRNGMTLALVGVSLGLLGAFSLTRLMTHLLFGVSPTDALTFAIVSLGLMAVSLFASYIPARRATKVDPLQALRYE